MSDRYHPDDTEAVEKLHARFMSDNNLNDQLIEFQDKAYAMGRARGLKEAAPAFDEAAELAAFEKWYGHDCQVTSPNAYIAGRDAWLECAKRKAGVL